MRYFMELAGRTALVDTSLELRPTAESIPFLRPATKADGAAAGRTVLVRPAERLEPMPEGGHWEVNRYYVETPEEKRVYSCALRGWPPYALTVWDRGTGTVTCRYLRGQEEQVCLMRNLWELLGIETLLLEDGGLLLHAALVRWQGIGVVFSAPSGTGKSTQAELWRRHGGAEILNGDRAGLMPCGSGWDSWGLPCAGSSGIYRNERAPLKIIAVLRQGPENRVARLRPARAFAALLPEITVHRWDRDFTQRASEALERLVTQVPAYILECRPDRGAVEALRAVLDGGERI